jgi:hypothetical protein
MTQFKDFKDQYLDLLKMVYGLDNYLIYNDEKVDQAFAEARGNERLVNFMLVADEIDGWVRVEYNLEPKNNDDFNFIDVLTYLNRETKAAFTISASSILFSNKTDAMLYKIKFGGGN